MKSPVNIKQQVDVCLGRAGTHIGDLTYVKQGKRENTAFDFLLALDDFSRIGALRLQDRAGTYP